MKEGKFCSKGHHLTRLQQSVDCIIHGTKMLYILQCCQISEFNLKSSNI